MRSQQMDNQHSYRGESAMSPLPAVETKSAGEEEERDVICHDGVCGISLDFSRRLRQQRTRLFPRVGTAANRVAMNDNVREHR